ncbi:MAG: hypothetical protein HOP19_08480 [Acidobacteria bacterium]|nr:hypothetical protein [Acidobacteriota bacterium]
MTVIGFRVSGTLRIFFLFLLAVTCLLSLPHSLKPAASANNAAATALICPPVPTGGDNDVLVVWLSSAENGSNVITNGSYKPSGPTMIYIHASAYAEGTCQNRFPVYVPEVGYECADTIKEYYKTSAIGLSYYFAGIGATSDTLNSVGSVSGKECAAGRTTDYNLLSTINTCNWGDTSTPSTGPRILGFTPLPSGVYLIRAYATMAPTACEFRRETPYKYANVYSNPEGEYGCNCPEQTKPGNAGGGGGTSNGTTTVGANNGMTGDNTSVGEPVSVISGNMYLDQADFELSGLGAGLQVTRAYNSLSNRIGLFGESWTSNLEMQALSAGPDHFFLRWGDGSGTFFQTVEQQ